MEATRLNEWLRRVNARWSSIAPPYGQGLVEYALILVLVVLVAFVIITFIGPWVGNDFSNIINTL